VTEICVLLLINFTFDENVIEYEPVFALSYTFTFVSDLFMDQYIKHMLFKYKSKELACECYCHESIKLLVEVIHAFDKLKGQLIDIWYQLVFNPVIMW
jgi:hypothetical protein